MERIMEFAFCLIAAIVCLTVGIMQLNERGIPLNKAYLYASNEKKQSMNKLPYFKQSGILFILMSVIFSLLAASVLFGMELLSSIALGLFAVVVIFAVVSTVIIEGSPKRFSDSKFLDFFAKNNPISAAHNIITANAAFSS